MFSIGSRNPHRIITCVAGAAWALLLLAPSLAHARPEVAILWYASNVGSDGFSCRSCDAPGFPGCGCDYALTCDAGMCEPAGGLNEQCLPDDPRAFQTWCLDDLGCLDGFCVPIGGLGEYCREGTEYWNTILAADPQTLSQAGTHPGPSCDDGLACDGEFCQQSGGKNQICNEDGTCDDGNLVCVAGRCIPRPVFKGDLSCKYGDRDCNRCAPNVEQQFRSLTRGTAPIRRKAWVWDDENYAPDQINPSDVMTILPGPYKGVGPGDGSHYQGFVRLAAPKGPSQVSLFASHGGDQSSIFAMTAPTLVTQVLGAGTLRYAFDSYSNHPGGMQGLGRYVLIAHDEYRNGDPNAAPAFIEIIDADKLPSADAGNVIKLEGSRSQSVGAVKMSGGGYLVVVGLRKNDFSIYQTPALDKPAFVSVSAETVHADSEASVDGELAGYENISLVTECETGSIYMIGATGGGAYNYNKGLWSLHKLESLPYPYFRHLADNNRDLYDAACDSRASGSAFVGADGGLSLYCHQKGYDAEARTDGTLCATGVASIVLGTPLPLPLFGAACTDALQDDSNVLFTEISNWKDAYYLRVKIEQRGPNSEMGVRDVRLGLDCRKTSSSSSKECLLQLPAGEWVSLQRYGDPNAQWWPDDGAGSALPCQEGPAGLSETCSFTMNDHRSIASYVF